MGGGARPSRQRSARAKACISRPVVRMGQKDSDSGARPRNRMELEKFVGRDLTTPLWAILVRMMVREMAQSSKVPWINRCAWLRDSWARSLHAPRGLEVTLFPFSSTLQDLLPKLLTHPNLFRFIRIWIRADKSIGLHCELMATWWQQRDSKPGSCGNP